MGMRRTTVEVKIDIRQGMPGRKLTRDEFDVRYRAVFADPGFKPYAPELERIADAAWDAYAKSRKSPHTRAAGPGFADPSYELSQDWLAATAAIQEAAAAHDDRSGASRILLINGSARTEHTCPGEMSKSWRLVELARRTIERQEGFEAEILDLSRATSEYGKNIYPCKSCASTAMPLCHWPCSCYPNHALGQVHDWMNEIYPMWARAHGVMIVTPVNWYHVPSTLKAMMDRMVCADGGNPDPTSTHGKNVEEAKALELAGWPYPRHLAGRLFSVVVHGDAVGAETVRRSLVDWATDMHMTSAGARAEVDGYVGYYEPYATSHAALDGDRSFQAEVENAARTLCEAVRGQRAGELTEAGAGLTDPRPK